MHGVKREKTSAQAKAARKAKEAARLEAYVAVEARFFELRDADDHSEAALEQTTKLLSLNPEFFSVWNYRRSILSHLFESTQADAEADADGDKHAARIALLQDDLELTMHALRAHPKVYWIWSHRTWCLDSLPDPKRDGSKWKKELKLVEHMLDLDPRNFHGWDYRRHLLVQLSLSLSSSPSSSSDPTPSLPATTTFPDILPTPLLKQELAYTLRKIESNFSNFSAWHQRSRVLPALWAREQADAKQRAQQRDEELELIRQAMYTDPSDSSIWIYHRWLVSGELEDADADADGGAQGRGEPVLDREIAGIEELLEMEPDSKWCLDTVAHYKTLKRSRLLAGGGERSHDEQVGELTTGIRNLLARLQQVDPLRKARYQDWLEAL
ncbi:Rab geranylgeranyltransferase [Tilletia horrida]|uniref:Geranylgeranyl transferase type-2 subunit alpha n=1 Tax=Tilletia horrida TaxID=155126 RepID=A0AAN6GAP4_9BASI|nr:Rab geranylgeranyltransferase [Tilletia horrida]